MIRILIALACAGCDRRATITSCDQDLTGEYASEATGEQVPLGRAAAEQHWMVVDHGARLEVFPLFADVPGGDLEIAPRTIELARTQDGTLRGDTRRRYMKGSASCVAKVPARIARCASDTLEIVHAETAPPLGFAPCQFGRTEPARVERWNRH